MANNNKLIAILLVMILLISVIIIADNATEDWPEEVSEGEEWEEEDWESTGGEWKEEEEGDWPSEIDEYSKEWEEGDWPEEVSERGGWEEEPQEESFFNEEDTDGQIDSYEEESLFNEDGWMTDEEARQQLIEEGWIAGEEGQISDEQSLFNEEGWMTDEEARQEFREQGFEITDLEEGEQYTEEELTQMGWEETEAPTTKPGIKSRPLTFLSQFLTAYDQYRGFSRFSSLFFTSEAWERHREKVNQIFCDTIILGGTQCWTSRICDTQLYPLVQRGTFSGRTPSGERQATATIQGEKSLPIQAVDNFGNPTMLRLYKITYAINNPYEAQELKYNIQFRTEDGYKINWFPDYQTTPASRTEASPLMQYGKNDYSAVCLIFHPSLIDYKSNWHGRRIREWCTPIIQYIGTATKPYPTASNTPEETTTPSAPAGLPEIEEEDEHPGF